ncbi:very short patch repair endonuclease [Collinsella sp. An268]|nr:very short patch repair endonuclease [Collinsella sp. An268]
MRREARRARTRDGRIAAAVARHGRCALKTVHVAAGIIRRMEDGTATGEVLAVQRGYGDMRGLWEFPGGKVERGETAEDACQRELAEELGITVEHLRAFYTVEYDYPDFHLSMECFFCRLATGEPTRSDRQLDLRWVGRGELLSLAWMPADEGLVEALAAAPAHDDEAELVRRRAAIRKSMQGNKRANTKPELLVRQRLRAAGYTGYRLQWAKAPGRPDIAFPGRKIAIFINGCFWHRCPHCHPSVPKRNTEFWEAKFRRNVERDKAAVAALEEAGWAVITIWECELKRKKIDETMERVLEQVRAAW